MRIFRTFKFEGIYISVVDGEIPSTVNSVWGASIGFISFNLPMDNTFGFQD